MSTVFANGGNVWDPSLQKPSRFQIFQIWLPVIAMALLIVILVGGVLTVLLLTLTSSARNLNSAIDKSTSIQMQTTINTMISKLASDNPAQFKADIAAYQKSAHTKNYLVTGQIKSFSGGLSIGLAKADTATPARFAVTYIPPAGKKGLTYFSCASATRTCSIATALTDPTSPFTQQLQTPAELAQAAVAERGSHAVRPGNGGN